MAEALKFKDEEKKNVNAGSIDQKASGKGEEKAPKLKEKISVTVVKLGTDPIKITVDAGTTLNDVIKSHNMARMEIRVRRKQQNLTLDPQAELQQDDSIIGSPDQIVGG